ncbi:MAG: TetR/AcrR family transcriptional regulator [Clostridiales bacterium]|nr:TetR/AcrR family transcriptional regulator [Clostridiales bacterium]
MSKEKAQKGRREEIIRAALAAYGEKGIYNTRIEEVAAAAGIGKGTVYEYFRSKEELLSAAIRFEMEESAGQVRENAAKESTVRGKLKAIVETVMLRRRENCYQTLDMSLVNMGGSMKDLQSLVVEQNALWQGWLEEIIDMGVTRGEIRRVDARVCLGAVMGAILYLVQPLGNSPWDDLSPGEAAQRVTDFFFEGIGK